LKRFAVLSALALSLGAFAESAKPPPGPNWQVQVLKATGSGAPDMKAANKAQARLGAEKAAQMDALRNLVEQVKGIQISAGKTVGDSMAKDEVKGKVEGVLRGFKVTGKRYFDDGGIEVDVEVPLSALTEIIIEPSGSAVLAVKTDGEKKNTGLVIDARGLEVKPALSPKVVDEAGKELYGVNCLSAEARKTSGVAAYVNSLEEAKKSLKVGDKPLVLKASKAKGTDLVLAADDVKKLGETNNSYLAEGRVVIVTN
jgi:hypothetical protein